jgi:hypothetical protein
VYLNVAVEKRNISAVYRYNWVSERITINEQYGGEVGKGKRADIYLEGVKPVIQPIRAKNILKVVPFKEKSSFHFVALSSPKKSLFIGHASNPPYPY